MIFESAILAGVTLVREAIQSSNFLTGITGWRIASDGSAEFNNVVIRGGTTIGSTLLAYNGTPALGNLVLSFSSVGGTDVFGNVYGIGLLSYGVKAGVNYFSSITNSSVRVGERGQTFPGGIDYRDKGSNVYELTLTSGSNNLPGDNPATILLTSESVPGAGNRVALIVAETIHANGEFHADNIQSGLQAVTPVVGSWIEVAVSFPFTFNSVPVVTATPNAGAPAAGVSSTTLMWAVTGVTASGFLLRVSRSSTALTTFGWTAITT